MSRFVIGAAILVGVAELVHWRFPGLQSSVARRLLGLSHPPTPGPALEAELEAPGPAPRSSAGPPDRPRLSISAPRPGDMVRGQTLVDAEISALAEIGRVEFEVNGETTISASELPFCFDWDTTRTANGPATLRVVVYNPQGQAQAASSVRVRVQN